VNPARGLLKKRRKCQIVPCEANLPVQTRIVAHRAQSTHIYKFMHVRTAGLDSVFAFLNKAVTLTAEALLATLAEAGTIARREVENWVAIIVRIMWA
jgi:hypothetical protein